MWVTTTHLEQRHGPPRTRYYDDHGCLGTPECERPEWNGVGRESREWPFLAGPLAGVSYAGGVTNWIGSGCSRIAKIVLMVNDTGPITFPTGRSSVMSLRLLGAWMLAGALTGAQETSVVIDPSGDGLGHTFDKGRGVAVTTTGVVFAIDEDGDVFRRNLDGTVDRVMDTSGDGQGNPLILPIAIAVDEDECVYVAGITSDNVFRILPNGTIAEVIDSTGDGSNLLDGPRDIAVDNSGNLYVVAGSSANVFRVAPDGTISLVLDGISPSPRSVDVDVLDNLYVASAGPGGILRIPLDGTAHETVNPYFDFDPLEIVAGPYGDIFVLDGGGEVAVVRPSGRIETVISLFGDGMSPFCGTGIAVDSVGNLFATGSDCSIFGAQPVVLRMRRNATFIRPIDSSGDGTTPLPSACYPGVGPTGTLFVTGNSATEAWIFRVIPSCVSPASSALRYGTGINPIGFVETAPASPGGFWETSVDMDLLGADLSIVAPARDALAAGVVLPFGELLIRRPFFLDVAAGHHSIAIPDGCSLVGMSLTSQAFTVRLSPASHVLHNAIDFTIGTYY